VTIVEIPEIVRTYVDAFSRRDVDACFDTFAADGTYSDPGTAQPLSGQAFNEHFAGFFAGFPDAKCETVGLNPISEHLWVWRWVLRVPTPAHIEVSRRRVALLCYPDVNSLKFVSARFSGSRGTLTA
jgi:SnoaL-like domain